MTTFFKKMEKLCGEKGISLTALCREIGINSSAVTSWKKGAVPQNRTLRKICDYFNVPMSYFDDDVVSFPTEPYGKGHP